VWSPACDSIRFLGPAQDRGLRTGEGAKNFRVTPMAAQCAREKYRSWYNQLIQKRRLAPIFSAYTEVHHIVPRSLGGGDEKSNLIALTYREHFMAHWLLTKLYDGQSHYKMVHAFHAMTLCANGTRIIAGWQFEITKRVLASAVRERLIERATKKARQEFVKENSRKFASMGPELSIERDKFLASHNLVRFPSRKKDTSRSRYRRKRRHGKKMRMAMKGQLPWRALSFLSDSMPAGRHAGVFFPSDCNKP
jgi:hypothetical protein